MDPGWLVFGAGVASHNCARNLDNPLSGDCRVQCAHRCQPLSSSSSLQFGIQAFRARKTPGVE